MNSSMPELSFRFSSPGLAFGSEAPQCYTFDVNISILLHEDGEKKEVGTINLSVINVSGAINSGIRLSDLFAEPARIARFLPVLFELPDPVEGYWLSVLVKKAILNEIDHCSSIMLIHLIDINKEFAGRRLALMALDELVNKLNFGCSLISLQAGPMQFIKNSGFPDYYGLPHELATEKLKLHYRKVGFRVIGDTDFLVASPLLARPTDFS